MAEALKGNKKTELTLTEVVPTLFIGLGGTGAEVLWRIRRKILSKVWHDENGQPFELGSLEEFPFAQFLHIDTDSCADSTSTSSDQLTARIRFKEEEKLVKKFDIDKYIKSDVDLAKYPMVQEWFPVSRDYIDGLSNDSNHAAWWIRPFSRLYFFDKYAEIKSAIRTKADHLLANVSPNEAQKRLGIRIEMGALKIVVVASTAGGTGSGMFLDMGYLSGIIGKQVASGYVTTNLVLWLPTGYASANRTRHLANTYAALMELETCMRPGSRYIKGWNEYGIIRDWPDVPYSDVYLVDTKNLAGAQSKDIKDVYDMVADSLFNELSMSEFSNRKRCVVVCKKRHKVSPYLTRVDREIYGDMKLTFSRGYSSFGQATLDFGHDSQVGIDADQENPLFAALDAHPNRGQLFSDFLQRAMPWVDANLDKYLKADYSQNQYTCLIGVKDSKEFEARYGSELCSHVPTYTLMAPSGIIFVEIDTPGKVVCYVELSGLPLPSLKALDNWYTAYREESVKIPVHTHKRASTFVHPRELTTDELATRVEDFKLFVEAVALGVLARTERGEEVGWYKMQVEGVKRNIGDEKRLRQESLPATYRMAIRRQVDHSLGVTTNDDQLALWVAVMEYYLGSVYPLAIRQVGMNDLEWKALPTFICKRMVDEWTSRLQRKTGGETQAERLLRAARDALIKWTEEIPGSTADVYQYEVNFKALKPKRVLKREVLQADWTLGDVQPPLQELAYFVAVNGQPTGPHNAAMLQQLVAGGHLTPQTKVWKRGMSGWMDACHLLEIQNLFVALPPPPLI